MKTLFIGALLFTATINVSAGEVSSFCEYGTYKQMLNGECECTKHFPKKEIPKIVPLRKGQKLVSVCSFVKSQQDGLYEGPSGFFNFEANESISGVIHYSVGPAGVFNFSTKIGNVSGWLESESDDLKEFDKLKAPLEIQDAAYAQGKLRVKRYYIQYNSGAVERSGITKYDVIKIGKFQSPNEAE